MQAILGKRGCGLIGGFTLGKALHADPEPGLVHHHKHQLEAGIFLADQPARRLLIGHITGGVAVNAHLLFQACAIDGIAFAGLARGGRNEFRHDKQANALDARRRAIDPGQHQVDDVFGHVVLARRDPDLLTGNLIGSIGLRNRLGAQQAKICATLRLGQVHGAAPLGRTHLW